MDSDVVQSGSLESARLLGGVELVEIERQHGVVAACRGVREQLDVMLALPFELVDVIELVPLVESQRREHLDGHSLVDEDSHQATAATCSAKLTASPMASWSIDG